MGCVFYFSVNAMAALHTALASHPDVSSVKTCSVVRDSVQTTSRHLDSSQERQDNAAYESDEGGR